MLFVDGDVLHGPTDNVSKCFRIGEIPNTSPGIKIVHEVTSLDGLLLRQTLDYSL